MEKKGDRNNEGWKWKESGDKQAVEEREGVAERAEWS